METSYEITASITATSTYTAMLAKALGYRSTLPNYNPMDINAPTEIPNPESEIEFLTKEIKRILVNETTRPIQNMAYNEANMQAQAIYDEVKQKADEGMVVVITEKE